MDDSQAIGDSERPAEAVAGEVFAGLFSAVGRADPYPLYARLRAFETTTGLLSNGLVALLAFPEQAARLRGSPSPELCVSAVEELLRFDSPSQLLFNRIARSDMEVGGLRLGAGQRVTTLLGAGNRDPAVFSAPDSLILDRREQPPLSFGGIHYCLGAPLARLEATVAFPALLSRYPRLSLNGTPVSRSGAAFRGHTRLPVSTG